MLANAPLLAGLRGRWLPARGLTKAPSGASPYTPKYPDARQRLKVKLNFALGALSSPTVPAGTPLSQSRQPDPSFGSGHLPSPRRIGPDGRSAWRRDFDDPWRGQTLGGRRRSVRRTHGGGLTRARDYPRAHGSAASPTLSGPASAAAAGDAGR
ncbi:hypothetical protein OIU85_004540 [Salix viminalis]|uniref:Uncharacterized protein n=1 Tax=Salix viminalis TaxID=40686 RepID=A0A9Q0SYG7_SALVM|nr:hypothetical protein OIU85_004540 [Salix viminalis]